ncbi:hypothetical protein ACLM47_08400 [Lactococcus lactis]|uniref:hypothetical protein n=1 Tax=Lactococcus lactis TaxID=1358 RepID=UPI00398F1F54
MYLKKVEKNTVKQLADVMPFASGTWYRKMNSNGTVATNSNGHTLYTCMNHKELQDSLKNKEFTRVEF